MHQQHSSVIYRFLCGVSRVFLISALIAAPWFFGGVTTEVQFWLYAAVLAALAIWIPGAMLQSLTWGLNTNRLPLALITLIGCVGLGIYQITPDDPGISAETIQSDFESSVTKSLDEVQRRELGKTSLIHSLQTVKSICPAVTRFGLSKLIIALAAFFLGTQLFATSKAQTWLWACMAINGAALSFFGICQILSWNGKLFWTVPLTHGGSPFASFVNKNNAAGYLCLCLAAALGCAAASMMKSGEEYLATDFQSTHSRGPHARSQRRHRQFATVNPIRFLDAITGVRMATITIVALIAGGIVLAASRGGWLALVVATLVTGILVTKSRGLSFLALVIGIGLLLASFVSWMGLGDRISDRWNDFVSVDTIANDSRWKHWSDSINAVYDFPLFGTGYGTYQFAYLPYQTHPIISHVRFYNADNQFLEWFVEGGLTGISLILLSILLVFCAIIVLLRAENVRHDPVGVVGIFALVSQCVSAFFDFGPTMPANMLTLATLFGAITGRAALLAGLKQLAPKSWGFSLPALFPSVLIPLLGIAILGLGTLGLNEVKAAMPAHRISRNLPRLDSPDSLNDTSVAQMIDQLSEAIVGYPDDPDVHFALASLMIYRFRLEEYRLAHADENRRPSSEIWLQTNPVNFYRQANLWDATGQFERIQSLAEIPTIQSNLVAAYDHLKTAQSKCALMPDVSQRLAIFAFAGDPTKLNGEAQLRRAVVLEPTSSRVFCEVGQLAGLANLTDFSLACWRKSLELGPEYLLQIHQSASERYSLDEELERVIPKSGEMLLRLSQSITGGDSQSKREKLAQSAIDLLGVPVTGVSEADRFHLLGQGYSLLGDKEAAITKYQQALELSPVKIEWRLELVNLLLALKGPKAALREAEVCVVIDPHQKRLQELVLELQAKVPR